MTILWDFSDVFMEKHVKKSRFFYRFLGSYFLVALLPILIIVSFFCMKIQKNINDEIMVTVKQQLHQFKMELEFRMFSMQYSTNQLSHLKVLGNEVDNLQHYVTAVEELNRAKENLAFVDQIILYNPQSNYVVTQSTSCTKERFFSRVCDIEGLDFEKAVQEVKTNSIFSYYIIKNHTNSSVANEAAFFVFPIKMGVRQNAYIIYVMNEARTQFNLLDNNYYQAFVSVTDSNGNILLYNTFSSDHYETYSPKALQDSLLHNEKDHFISLEESSDVLTGWRFNIFLPKSGPAFQSFRQLNKEFALILLLTAFISSLIIALLSRVNYRPFKAISSSLDKLTTENLKLREEQTRQKSHVQQQLLMRVLNGQYASLEEFSLDSMDSGIDLEEGPFFVWNLYFPYMTPAESQNLVLVPPEAFSSYEVRRLNTKEILFLSKVHESTTSIDEVLKTFHEDVKQNQAGAILSYGSVAHEFSVIRKSYLEAMVAKEYAFILEPGSLISYTDVVKEDYSPIRFPYSLFSLLQSSFIQNDAEQLLRALEGILGILADENLLLYLAKGISGELLRLISTYRGGFEINQECHIGSLDAYQNKYEVIEATRCWMGALKDSMEKKESDDEFSFDEVLAFMQVRALDGNFSIYEVADNFNMGISTFSKLFKQESGKTFTDWLTSYRMTRAKLLLENTEVGLDEIAFQVGYFNTSSFIRRFKQINGVTPKQYRQSFFEK